MKQSDNVDFTKSQNRSHKKQIRRGHRPSSSQKSQPLDSISGLPLYLHQDIQAQYSEQASLIVDGWSASRRTTLRTNTLRATRDEIADELNVAGIRWSPVAWYPEAVILAQGTSHKAVEELEAYQTGKLYLQSLSSMLPPLCLNPRSDADILDMCAAPGSKTSELCALSQDTTTGKCAHITACELSHPRAKRLRHNLSKLGCTTVTVMQTDSRHLDEFFSFDQILLDAPCTGSGTLRAYDAHAARATTPELARRVEKSQRALMNKALDLLKPGGELIYATCSVREQENEDIVSWALKQRPDCSLGPLHLGPAYHTGPSALPELDTRIPGTILIYPTEFFEGFFVAKLTKKQ